MASPAHSRPAAAARSTSPARLLSPFTLAGAALCLGVVALSWSSVSFAPIALDDRSLLADLAAAPWTRALGHDRFGHLRPLKSALFWWLAHHPAWLPGARAAVLAAYALTVALLQRLALNVLRSRGWALAAAACWGLNPTVPSTVAWLSAANQVVAVLGVIGYVLAGARACSATADRADTRAGWSLAACGCLLCALLAHELALAAPLMLWAFTRWFGCKDEGARAPRLLIAGSASTLALLAVWHLALGAPHVSYRLQREPAALLVLSAARYALENLRLWLWQAGAFGVLLADQPAAHVAGSALCWLALIALAAAALISGRRDRALAFGAAWTAVFLLPVTNLVPLGITPVAPHYLYLPGIGLALITARCAQRWQARLQRWSPLARALPVTLLALLLLAWLPERQRTLAAWGDEQRLFAETIRNHPEQIEPRVNLIALELERGDLAAAQALLDSSLHLAPDEPALLRNQLELLWRTDRTQAALELLDRHPVLATPRNLIRRGRVLEQLGRADDARAAFARAFAEAREPEDRFAAGYRLATALAAHDELRAAEALIDQLLREFPGRRELTIAKRLLSDGNVNAAPAP